MLSYLMKCGHVVHIREGDQPLCPICTQRTTDAGFVVKKVGQDNEGLAGREAMCTQCGKKTPSRWMLPFFHRRPDKKYDEYYDGCRGWD